MKKVFGIFMLLSCLLLVGCGKAETNTQTPEKQVEEDKNKVLVCTMFTENTVNFDTEMSYYYEGDTLTKLGVKYIYDLSGYNDEQRQAFAGSKMCEMDAVTNTLGMVDCKEELVGTDYILEGSAEKLLTQVSGTLTEVKAAAETENWKCSVK